MGSLGDFAFSKLGGPPTGDRDITEHYYLEVISRTVLGASPSAPDERITFNGIPEVFDWSKQAVYQSETILGRSETIRVYSSSLPTITQFTGKLIATGGKTPDPGVMAVAGGALGLVGRFYAPAAPFLGIAGNIGSLVYDEAAGAQAKVAQVIKEVHVKLAKLEALTYPQYDKQGIAYPPPKVRLVFGLNFVREGIITSFSAKVYGPFEINMMVAFNADVTMNFEEANPTPLGYEDVRNSVGERLKPVVDQPRESIWDKLKRDAVSTARSKFGI